MGATRRYWRRRHPRRGPLSQIDSRGRAHRPEMRATEIDSGPSASPHGASARVASISRFSGGTEPLTGSFCALREHLAAASLREPSRRAGARRIRFGGAPSVPTKCSPNAPSAPSAPIAPNADFGAISGTRQSQRGAMLAKRAKRANRTKRGIRAFAGPGSHSGGAMLAKRAKRANRTKVTPPRTA